jgi:hypothetical protein
MKIEWRVMIIDEVMEYFVKGFQIEGKLLDYEKYYDPATGKVAFKLYVEEKP